MGKAQKKTEERRAAVLQDAGIPSVGLTRATAGWPDPPVGRQRTSDEKDVVIGLIVKDMQAGRYVSGPSQERYMRLGEATASTVRGWIAEASRRAYDSSNPEHVQELRQNTVNKLVARAEVKLAARNPVDDRGAVEMLRLANEVGGTIKSDPRFTNVYHIGDVVLDLAALMKTATSNPDMARMLAAAAGGKMPELGQGDIVEQDPVLQGILERRAAGDDDAAAEHMLYVGCGTLDRSSPEAQSCIAAFAKWGSDGKTEDDT